MHVLSILGSGLQYARRQMCTYMPLGITLLLHWPFKGCDKKFMPSRYCLMKGYKPIFGLKNQGATIIRWNKVHSFPQTLFDHWTLLVGRNIPRYPFWEKVGVLHSENPGAGCEGWFTAQPSAGLQCPLGELVLLLPLSPGHLWPCLTLKNGSNFLGVSLPPPLFFSPPSGIWGICLPKLINLFNDAISFFHISLCP